jgi:peptide deformylase
MAVLEIITAPHPILEMRARDVDPDEFGPELDQHTKDMAETMYAAPGVGLAAPQVSDPRRIMVIDSGEKEARGSRFFAFVNPKIVEASADMIPWNETCLSVPEFEIEIQRHRKITVEYQTPLDGSVQRETFEDYEAVIVQHELDHLAGTVLLDRASRMKRARYMKKVSKLKKRLKELA